MHHARQTITLHQARQTITFAPCKKKREQRSYKPGSVPATLKKTTVSAIYLVYESPHSSSILPSIVTKVGRTILKQWFTRTCGLQMTQPTDRPVAGGLLHHLLTLTHLSAGGCFLLPYPTVTNSFYFRKWSVLCRPDFPLATKGKRQTGALLSDCKINKFKRKTAHTDLFLFAHRRLGCSQQHFFLNSKHLFFYAKDPSPPHWQTKTCKQPMVNK